MIGERTITSLIILLSTISILECAKSEILVSFPLFVLRVFNLLGLLFVVKTLPNLDQDMCLHFETRQSKQCQWQSFAMHFADAAMSTI